MDTLNVYVPKIGTPAHEQIITGSGIVGSRDAMRVRIDFEGNRYGASNIRTWADRVSQAAGRHTWNDGRGYPTIARSWVPAEELTLVATFEYDENADGTWNGPGQIELVEDAPAQLELAAWLGGDPLPLSELEMS